MINKYSDFILEKLIIESNVVFSDKFRAVLTKMNSDISKKLLSIENKDLPVRGNYFDVTSVNDIITFIPDAKAQEILSNKESLFRYTGDNGGWLKHSDANAKLFKELGYVPDGTPYRPNSREVGKEISRITSALSGNVYVYLQFEDGKGVYNINTLRSVDNIDQSKLWKTSRQQVRVGRAVRALLQAGDVKSTAKEIEDFVNSFKATIDKFNDVFSYFSVVKGDDIAHFYNRSNYYRNKRGTLYSSCMCAVEDTFFNIYCQNPDVCSLVILKSQDDDTLITGRALLWTLSDGKKFMDRIYTINDSDVSLFRDYAKENGWYVKKYNRSDDSAESIHPDGGEVDLGTIKVNIRPKKYGSYPYLDTLKRFDPNQGTLTNHHNPTANEYLLESTDGNVVCPYCEGEGYVYDEDDDCDHTCSYCDGEGTMEL